jgi:hypothetical protein
MVCRPSWLDPRGGKAGAQTFEGRMVRPIFDTTNIQVIDSGKYSALKNRRGTTFGNRLMGGSGFGQLPNGSAARQRRRRDARGWPLVAAASAGGSVCHPAQSRSR